MTGRTGAGPDEMPVSEEPAHRSYGCRTARAQDRRPRPRAPPVRTQGYLGSLASEPSMRTTSAPEAVPVWTDP